MCDTRSPLPSPILLLLLLHFLQAASSYRISLPSRRITPSLAELPMNTSETWQNLRFIHGGRQAAITKLLNRGLGEFTFSSWGKAKLGPGLYTTAYISGLDWTKTNQGGDWYTRIWNYERSGWAQQNIPFQLVLRRNVQNALPKIALVGCDIWYEKGGTWAVEGSKKLECMESHAALAVVSLSARCGTPARGVKPACQEIHRKNTNAQGCVTLTPDEAAAAFASECFMEVKWNLPLQPDILELVAVANWPERNKEGQPERIHLSGQLGSSIVNREGSKFIAGTAYRHQGTLSWALSGFAGAPDE